MEKVTFSTEYMKLREDFVIKNRCGIEEWIGKEEEYIHLRGKSPMRTYVDQTIKTALGHDPATHWKVVWKRIRKLYFKLQKRYKWQNEPKMITLTESR